MSFCLFNCVQWTLDFQSVEYIGLLRCISSGWGGGLQWQIDDGKVWGEGSRGWKWLHPDNITLHLLNLIKSGERASLERIYSGRTNISCGLKNKMQIFFFFESAPSPILFSSSNWVRYAGSILFLKFREVTFYNGGRCCHHIRAHNSKLFELLTQQGKHCSALHSYSCYYIF